MPRDWGWERRYGVAPSDVHADEQGKAGKNWRWKIQVQTRKVWHSRGRRHELTLNPVGLRLYRKEVGGSYSMSFRSHTYGYTGFTVSVFSQSLTIQRQYVSWTESREQYLYNRALQQKKFGAFKAAVRSQGCDHSAWPLPERAKPQPRTVLIKDGVDIGVGPDPAKAGVWRCFRCNRTFHFNEELMQLLDTPYMKEAS